MTPDAAMPPLLDAAGVRKHYRRPFGEPVTALAGVDVQIHAGKSVGIAGESGSGKSSMLRLLLQPHAPECAPV